MQSIIHDQGTPDWKTVVWMNVADKPPPTLPWPSIHTVLLDMDGTLLDLNFDNTFFHDTVPRALVRQRGGTLEEAKAFLHTCYKSVEGTLAWYDLDYWSRHLGMDIPRLKEEVAHLIQPHPQAMDFLQTLQAMGKTAHLVTNAHAHSLALKLRCTPIATGLASLTSSHELGFPKEDPAFWRLLQKKMGFSKASTLLVDDSEPVLLAAEQFGLRYLRHIAAPSSVQWPKPSKRFDSVLGLGALLPNEA